jgi:hypothetical protein
MQFLIVTRAAKQWLAALSTGRVLSAHTRACNLWQPSGALLALVRAREHLGPFAAQVTTTEAEWAALQVGAEVRRAHQVLWIGTVALELSLDFSEVPEWEARPNWASLAQRPPEDWVALRPLALRHAPPGSLLQPEGLPHGPRFLDARATLLAGLRANAPARIVAGVTQLAGLGPGLTPAGDDFLVGLIVALQLEAANPHRPLIAAAAAPPEAHPARTTWLSAAYLRAAARGECAGVWHAFLTDPTSETALRALLATGHTSGADGLAGFWAGRENV